MQTAQFVPTRNLAGIIGNPSRGTISLKGSHGGSSLITGNVEPSGLVPGTTSIETEHGTVYLDSDLDVEIIEET